MGQLHKSVNEYINIILSLEEQTFYTVLNLEKACSVLTGKNNSEIAELLNIEECSARNRYTSMILILGFMKYLNIEKVYVLNI